MISQALTLFNQGKRNKALDLIYDNIDNSLLSNDFKSVNALFDNLDVKNIPEVILVALLTITHAAHGKLESRSNFFMNVKKEFENRGVLGNGLLEGLEGEPHDDQLK